MKKNKTLVLVLAALLLIGLSSCQIDGNGSYTVLITNNSNTSFTGKVWTDKEELFDGTIRAWNSKTLFLSEEATVYTDFESSSGEKSKPSGSIQKYRTLILDL